MGLALLDLIPVDVAPYTHAPALSKGSNTCLPVRMTVWVYDVGTWVDIAAKWALSCKESSDDSSRACEAGDVGRGSILTMTDTASLLLRWSRRTVSALHMTSSLFTM